MINMPPPRQIPLIITIRSLFGGIRYQASWFFLGVFSVFFLGLAFDLSSFLLSRLNTEVVPGVLLEQQETWLTDAVVGTGGMLHRRGEPFYRYIYRYTAGGSAYLGDSYTDPNDLVAGDTVEVEYLEAFPGISRIRGMASEPHLSGGKAPLIIILVMILIASASTIATTRSQTSALVPFDEKRRSHRSGSEGKPTVIPHLPRTRMVSDAMGVQC
jgi:hypothetical protein